MPLQIRRGTEAERQAMTIPLAEGELLYVTDDQRLFIGGKTSDGTPILGGIQVTGYKDENAQDAAAALFAAGAHSNITFVYDDNANSISATIDLSDYQDVITADGVRAPILGTNDFELFNSVTNDVTLDGVVASDISPNETATFDLGSASSTFKDLYLDNSIWVGSAQITSDGSAINLPTGTTVNGLPIGSGSGDGVVEGSNYRINIIGEDSALLVDSVNGLFFGNLTGSVIGDVVGNTISTNELFVNSLLSNVNSDFTLSFNQQDGTPSSVFIGKYSNDTANPATISFQRSRGTVESPTAVATLDRIGVFNFRAYDGANYLTPAQIRTDVIGPVSTNIIPTATVFTNTDFNGNFSESARIDLSRGLSITRTGQTSFLASLQSIHDSNTTTGSLGFARSRGTTASPTAITENDAIIDIAFSGRSGPPPSFPTTLAFIRAAADGPVSTNVVPGRIELHTANLSGTLNRSMVLNNAGTLQVNKIEGLTTDLTITSASITDFLKLPIYADDTARSTAITTPAQGMVIFMQSGSAPAATNQPQYFDGTNWQNF